MVACPFGVMQIVLTPLAAGKVKATAHKCDLCREREAGPACVQNCPAQALQLADEETLLGLAKRRRLRAAHMEAQPWHSYPADLMPTERNDKVEQMAATPPRAEAERLAPALRKTHFSEIYLPLSRGPRAAGGSALPEVRRAQHLRMDLPAAQPYPAVD
nr:pyridine nucleotide-disulfide oxidoreductase family protein [Raoultella sp. NCTC 9187]